MDAAQRACSGAEWGEVDKETALVGCCPGLSRFHASRSFTSVTKTFFGAAPGEKSSLCLAEPSPQRQRYGPHVHGIYLLVGLCVCLELGTHAGVCRAKASVVACSLQQYMK